MALGSNNGKKSNSIFVDLKFNATKGADHVGFRQTISRTAVENPGPNDKKFNYETAMHGYVEGRVIGFVTREEPTYDDPALKEFIGYATIADVAEGGAEAGPNVVVKFPLAGSAGRRLIGLLNGVKDGEPMVHLYTNHAEAGSQMGDKVLEKPAAYINMRVGGVKGERVVPVYCDENGAPAMKEDGVTPAQLPMGVKVQVNKKDVWDFTAADDVTFNTAAALSEHYATQAEGHHEAPAGDDNGVDLNEAAAAAAPRG